MSDFNVVVVVDVQNCFMYANKEQNANFLNLGNINDSKDVAREISELVKKKTENKENSAVVFTRDYHPINHISFENDEGRNMNKSAPGTIWPRHCRNSTVKCAKRPTTEDIKDIEPEKSMPSATKKTLGEIAKSNNVNIKTVSDKLGLNENDVLNIPIKGTELSYYFYETNLANVVKKLNDGNKNGSHKIGLKSTKYETLGDKETIAEQNAENEIINSPAYDNVASFPFTKFIALTKGERCNEESYSAFNYHIKYDVTKPSTPTSGLNNLIEANSTGLWEWILANRNGATTINVTVCGLVGNVCVIFSVLQGMAMWEAVYAKENPNITVNFEYSLMGNRFTTALPPNKVKPYTDWKEDNEQNNEQNNAAKPFHWWMNELKGYYTGNIDDATKTALQNKSFKVLDYDGNEKGEVKLSDVFAEQTTNQSEEQTTTTTSEEPQKGGKRQSRRRPRAKRHTHKMDKMGYCKMCYKFCRTSRKNKKSHKSRK